MVKVSKILEATLIAGATSVTFNDADIPNSLIRVFCTNANLYPLNISLTSTSLTVSYEAQTSDMGVALELVKQGLNINDTLTSTADDEALSAKQGKVLKDAIDGLVIPDEITDLSDVEVTDIEDGQVLAWDEVSEKFVNVDSSASEYITYSSDEQKIGKWIDGSDLYKKTIDIGNLPNNTSKNVPTNISNIDKIIRIYGACNYITGGVLYSRGLPFSDSNYSNNIRVDFSNGNIGIVTASNWSTYSGYVTLEYTKTS